MMDDGNDINGMLQNFNNQKGNSPQDDFSDLLQKIMHAKNQGASDDDLHQLIAGISSSRAQGALSGGGMATMQRDPAMAEGRQTLQNLLRGR